MALTDVAVKQAKAKEKAYKLSDGAGLYLLINPNGSKYWRLKYRHAGKEKVLALGVYPEVKLAEARAKRDAARKQISNGLDPVAIKRDWKRKKKAQAENAFEKVAREWFSQQKESWSPEHAKRVLSSLQNDIFPVLGTRPINEITAPEVLDVIRRIEQRGAIDVASRALQRTKAVFRYAVQTGRTEQNPASDLAGALKTRKVKHRAALTRSDLPEFLEKLDQYSGQPITKLALRMILLTFVRTNELRGAQWKEFDLDRAEWRIPAERMKMDTPHIVPLSRQVIGVLKELEPLTGRFELLFPSQTNIKKPISENTLLYAMYRMGYHKRATVHGFRATASTILNESGFHHDAIERQLAHIERNKVRAAYHRSEYMEERRNIMQWWADFLDGCNSSKNIIPIMATAK